MDIGYETYIILATNMHVDRISENHLQKFQYHKYEYKVSLEFRIQLFCAFHATKDKTMQKKLESF